jgi:hypothetical protein
MMKAMAVHVLRTDTLEAGSPLFEFSLGGSYGLLRLHPEEEAEHGLQLGLHAGIVAAFDPGAGYDGIGWDGYYGLGATYRLADTLAAKLAYQHDSAHLGDEYVAKTGRARLGYKRDEVVLGVMVDPSRHVRVYTELGRAFHLGSPELAPWRAQSGIELRFRIFYAALDLSFSEELGFRPTATAQLGLLYERRGTGRRYGLFAQYEHGRSKYGEFFRDRSETLGGGWWVDL